MSGPPRRPLSARELEEFRAVACTHMLWYHRCIERLHRRGATGDAVFDGARAAEDALHRLQISIHYAGVELHRRAQVTAPVEGVPNGDHGAPQGAKWCAPGPAPE